MPANYLVWRQALTCLFLLDWACYLPYARIRFGEPYWSSHPLHGRLGRSAIFAVWPTCCILLFLGYWTLLSSISLWLIFRHLYISHRWSSLFRGGGAPGFMSHHQVAFLALFELSTRADATGSLPAWVATMYGVDLGVILLCSGTYKSLSGYLHDEGMEYGLANPFWGYWWPLFRYVPPGHALLRAQNRIAACGQVAIGLALILPQTRPVGALGCALSFAYLLPLVRLGRLAGLMMAAALPCLPDLAPFGMTGLLPLGVSLGVPLSSDALGLLKGLVVAYLVLLPCVKATQYLNLFGNRELPAPLQGWLTAYANAVPIIMWRVFTPDVTNFFIRISLVEEGTTRPLILEDTTYRYDSISNAYQKWRFLQVTESITITTVFTTLKYFESQKELFEARLVQYARSLQVAEPGRILFEYVAIRKSPLRFEYVPVWRFLVCTTDGTVEETAIDESFSCSARARFSKIRETDGFGSYAPRTDDTSRRTLGAE